MAQQFDYDKLRQQLGILSPQEVDLLYHKPYTRQPGEPDIPIIRNSYPVAAQGVVGFAFGMMLSPYSVGIEFVISFMVVYEIFIYAITEGKAPYWRLSDRIFVVSAYLLGWVMGRALAGWQDPFRDSPFVEEWRTLTPASGPPGGKSGPEQLSWKTQKWPFPSRSVGIVWPTTFKKP